MPAAALGPQAARRTPCRLRYLTEIWPPFATVRTIVDQSDGTDRTTQLRLERIPVDKLEVAKWKRQKRTRDALPKLAQDLVERGDALIKEAKGLGRDRLV